MKVSYPKEPHKIKAMNVQKLTFEQFDALTQPEQVQHLRESYDELIKSIEDTKEDIYYDSRYSSKEWIENILKECETLSEFRDKTSEELFDAYLDEEHEIRNRIRIDKVDEWIEENADNYFQDVNTEDQNGQYYSLRDYLIESVEDVYPEINYPFKNILNENIPFRISMYSNFDCINSFYFESQGQYSYDPKETNSYHEQVIKLLQMNPKQVQKGLNELGCDTLGEWEDNQELNPLVDINQFMEEEENRTCPACLLTFPIMINAWELFNLHDFKELKIKLPKGAKVGYYSSYQGGGSLLECELLRELTIEIDKPLDTKYDHFGLSPDCDKYSIQNVYGTDESIFSEVEILKNEEPVKT